MSDTLDNCKEIRRITWIGLFTNMFLTLLKMVLGIIGRSQAVFADAIHSLSDMLTDVAVLLGVKYWESPADDEHPYGHKRIETVITLFIGLLLGFVGFEIIFKAITTISEVHPESPLWVAAIGPFISIIIKEALYRWTVSIGTKAQSSAVIANAWHHRSDSFSSIPAFIAVLAASLNPAYLFVDHIGAVVVSIFILKVAIDIIKPALLEIMDKGVSKKEQQHILNVTLQTEGVRDVHKLRTRKMGGNCFIDLHVLVDGSLSVEKGHEISEAVEETLLANIPNVIDVVVHIEPLEETSKTT